jgi:hypothetical protein
MRRVLAITALLAAFVAAWLGLPTAVIAAPSAKPATTDRVVLVMQNGRYVIDDVEYGGKWDFATKGALRSTLAAALANPQ